MRWKWLDRFAVFVSVVCFPSAAVRGEVFFSIDQRNEPAPTQNFNVEFNQPRQAFTPVFSSLNRVDVRIADSNSLANSTADFEVRVFIGASNTPLATSEIVRLQDSGPGFESFDFVPFRLAAPVSLNPGFQYRFEVVNLSKGVAASGFSWTAGPGDDYGRGFPVLNGTADLAGRDFLFRLGLEQENQLDLVATSSGGIRRIDPGGPSSINETSFLLDSGDNTIRAVQEFDVSELVGRKDLAIVEATLSGEIGVNNALNLGTRLFELGTFQGDGVVTLADFSTPTELVGNVSLDVDDGRVAFNLDVTDQLTHLLAGNGAFFGLRTDPANTQPASVVLDPILKITVTAIPEPHLLGCSLLACTVIALVRRRE